MKLELKKFEKKFGKKIIFNEVLSKYSWFNLGGPAEIFFKPDNIDELKEFLINLNNSIKIICLGAGSNTLIRDGGFKGAIIKLSPKFSYIKKINDTEIEVGAATLDKKLSRYAAENSIAGFEFLSCIPGSIGGAICMNSGCYGDQVSDIISSIKTIDFYGKEKIIKKEEINFFYRGTNLPEQLIIVSANFLVKKGEKNSILNKISKYSKKKKESQPSQIKTCGSTFKNTKNKKAWELIQDSNCLSKTFGKASISKKHCNFFVNEGGASAEEIENLINFVRKKVFDKHKIELDLELKVIGEVNRK